jgi:hypothetical protein
MLLAVFETTMTLQIHAHIFACSSRESIDEVCPTSHFEASTLVNKGPNHGPHLKNRVLRKILWNELALTSKIWWLSRLATY